MFKNFFSFNRSNNPPVPQPGPLNQIPPVNINNAIPTNNNEEIPLPPSLWQRVDGQLQSHRNLLDDLDRLLPAAAPPLEPDPTANPNEPVPQTAQLRIEQKALCDMFIDAIKGIQIYGQIIHSIIPSPNITTANATVTRCPKLRHQAQQDQLFGLLCSAVFTDDNVHASYIRLALAELQGVNMTLQERWKGKISHTLNIIVNNHHPIRAWFRNITGPIIYQYSCPFYNGLEAPNSITAKSRVIEILHSCLAELVAAQGNNYKNSMAERINEKQNSFKRLRRIQ